MTDLIHYRLTEKEVQERTGSTGRFEGPNPLCNNGSFHVTTTRTEREVTCKDCLHRLSPCDETKTMARWRYSALQHGSASLTPQEQKDGWFFDDDYDGLLANRAWEGHGGSSD